MVRGAMECAEKDSRKAEPGRARSENHRGPFCGRPQVVGPPSNCLGRVPMGHETGEHPNGENQPCSEVRSLELPDVPRDVGAESERLDKI